MSEVKYKDAIQNLKTSNHQYAKRQVSWIRNKLLPAIRASNASEGSKVVEMYLLDATGLYFICVRLKWDNVDVHAQSSETGHLRLETWQAV
jgi:tRNA A37 N6-isopentenylltransferase MiaA